MYTNQGARAKRFVLATGRALGDEAYIDPQSGARVSDPNAPVPGYGRDLMRQAGVAPFGLDPFGQRVDFGRDWEGRRRDHRHERFAPEFGLPGRGIRREVHGRLRGLGAFNDPQHRMPDVSGNRIAPRGPQHPVRRDVPVRGIGGRPEPRAGFRFFDEHRPEFVSRAGLNDYYRSGAGYLRVGWDGIPTWASRLPFTAEVLQYPAGAPGFGVGIQEPQGQTGDGASQSGYSAGAGGNDNPPPPDNGGGISSMWENLPTLGKVAVVGGGVFLVTSFMGGGGRRR
jgi:hypothetical protein